jgi:hypothetical protein
MFSYSDFRSQISDNLFSIAEQLSFLGAVCEGVNSVAMLLVIRKGAFPDATIGPLVATGALLFILSPGARKRGSLRPVKDSLSMFVPIFVLPLMAATIRPGVNAITLSFPVDPVSIVILTVGVLSSTPAVDLSLEEISLKFLASRPNLYAEAVGLIVLPVSMVTFTIL